MENANTRKLIFVLAELHTKRLSTCNSVVLALWNDEKETRILFLLKQIKLSISERIEKIEKNIGYAFADFTLLIRAITHPSFANESNDATQDYERQEFLGDAVLELVVTEKLFTCFPEINEGILTLARSSLVKKTMLAEVFHSMELSEFVLLGKGEKKKNNEIKESIAANLFESILGAIFLDSNYTTAREWCLKWFVPLIENLDLDEIQGWKNKLQEEAVKRNFEPPEYIVSSVEGPEHDPEYTVMVQLSDELQASAKGRNKKEASKEAAKKLFTILKEKQTPDL